MEFEHAAKLRDQIEAIRSVIENQQVVSLANEDYDALGLFIEAGMASVTTFDCARRQTHRRSAFLSCTNIEGRDDAEVLSVFVRQHYEGPTSIPQEILTPHDLEDAEAIEEWLSEKADRKVGVRRPQRGDKVQSDRTGAPQRRTRVARTSLV